MIRKYLLILSILLNISLLLLVFQFWDKIYGQLFPPLKVDILLIGDSIIAQENWNILLERNDLKNEAFGGAITQQILWNIQRGQLNSNPKIVVIEAGINDLLSGIPAQRVFENYQNIIDVLQKKNIKIIAHLILYTADNQEINKKIFVLNSLLKAYFESQKIAFIDMNLYLSANQKLQSDFSIDGIHLQKSAYKIWAKTLKAKLPLAL
jgi:lysophospholipase L1-like esterase